METEEPTGNRATNQDNFAREPVASGLSRKRPVLALTKRRWLLVASLAVGVIAVVGLLLFTRHPGGQVGRPVPAPSGEPPPSPSSELAKGVQPEPGDITITLMPDKLENAGIRIEVATAQYQTGADIAGGLRTTGTVQSNEYRDTPVFPVAGGIVRKVSAELGDRVRRGSTLAVIFSTELAEAQSDYLKMLAEAEEHHQHYRRTVELLEIGAVSREELEMVTAKHKTAQAKLASSQQRLILLGMAPQELDLLQDPAQIKSLIVVQAPVTGTVISRAVNTGEVVDKGKELFRVADLSTVWVVGQIYETDFQSVQIGTRAVITTSAYPGQTFSGRVSYIDPRVDPNTRTAQVRVEAPNRGQILRLGMFVDVNFGGAALVQPGAVLVPRAALQTLGAKHVVYIAMDQPGVFIQREVTVGPETDGMVQIYGGVAAGNRIVTEGSFLLRAESLKLNPAQTLSRDRPLPSQHQH